MALQSPPDSGWPTCKRNARCRLREKIDLSDAYHMKTRKKKTTADPPTELDMTFGEALARFIGTDPRELVEAVTGDILKKRQDAEQRIKQARKELEDGARPRKGRFRL